MNGWIETEIGNIPSEWNYEPLDNFLELITYGFTNPMPTTDEGPFMITAKDITGGRVNYNTARHTSQEAFDNLLTDKSRPSVNDVLITKDGSIGRVGIVDKEKICINQSVALLRTNERIRPYYLKYLLESPLYQKLIERDADGSTIKHIYITRIDQMMVGIPELEEQDGILNILWSIDKKITLLRQQNQTLEYLAQTLFKRWFVDFEFPVKLSEHGFTGLQDEQGSDSDNKGYKSSGGRMVPSELGEIPEGWRVGKVGNIAVFKNGKSPKDRNENAKYPIYGANGIIGYSTHYNSDKETIIIGRVGSYCGSIEYSQENCWVTDNAIIGYGKEKICQKFLHRLLLHINLNRLSTGSGQPLLNQEILTSIEVSLPDNQILQQFEDVISSIYNKGFQNEKEIHTLTLLRDTLLPKLISGDLRVSESGYAELKD